jgi:phosphate:Na+ symporter
MTFYQSLAVTLGSELGSTFLGQLVAFPKITKLAPIIIAAGFFPSLLVKSRRDKNVSLTVLGFGLLFLGMDMMSVSLEPLKSYTPFLNLMMSVENPILGILIGLLFTMMIQSSGATSGITIAMAVSGTITLAQAVPINLGASIGTCITAVLGSLALNREAKRTAYIHVVFQTFGTLLVLTLLLIPFGRDRLWLEATRLVTKVVFRSDSLARQIAMAHSMMPILNHLFVIPLLPVFIRVFNRVYPPRREAAAFGPIYINDGLTEQPEIALEQAKKEVLRVAKLVEDMMQRAYQLLCCYDSNKERAKAIEEISGIDEKVDVLRNAVVVFVTKVSGALMSDAQSRAVVMLLYTINELENLADVIDINIADRARKLFEMETNLHEEGAQEIASLHSMVMNHYKHILTAYENNDKSSAETFLSNRAPFKELQAVIREQHFQRLKEGHKKAIETNPVYMDLLGHYNRMNRHVIHIAKRMVENL